MTVISSLLHVLDFFSQLFLGSPGGTGCLRRDVSAQIGEKRALICRRRLRKTPWNFQQNSADPFFEKYEKNRLFWRHITCPGGVMDTSTAYRPIRFYLREFETRSGQTKKCLKRRKASLNFLCPLNRRKASIGEFCSFSRRVYFCLWKYALAIVKMKTYLVGPAYSILIDMGRRLTKWTSGQYFAK